MTSHSLPELVGFEGQRVFRDWNGNGTATPDDSESESGGSESTSGSLLDEISSRWPDATAESSWAAPASEDGQDRPLDREDVPLHNELSPQVGEPLRLNDPPEEHSSDDDGWWHFPGSPRDKGIGHDRPKRTSNGSRQNGKQTESDASAAGEGRSGNSRRAFEDDWLAFVFCMTARAFEYSIG